MSQQISSPSVCVIGAGCSGITAVKNLIQAGVTNVVCYDQNSDVGGNWIYSAGESHSSVCETTHIISSKKLSEFMDYPMPDHYSDYPSHEEVLAYFRSYARHFGLYPYFRFNTKVEKVEKIAGERWRIKLQNGEINEFDFLFVANGHHNVPRWPELPGNFTGNYIHAHSYKTNQPFAGRRVLVIGAGNSGCDCAVETSRVAQFVGISMRRGHYIIPKFFFGKPTDLYNANMLWLPENLINWIRKLALKINVGRYRDYGLQEPDFPITKDHPTMNSELLYKIRHGKVHPRMGIAKIEGKTVTFTDGISEEYDVIIAATGYKIALPFFDKDFINYEDAYRVPLYLRMFHPDHPTLVFIGLFQPQGAIWPISDYQAKLAANYVMGRWQLPDNLRELAEKDSDFIEKSFLRKHRHAIEVHFEPFLKQVAKQIPDSAPEWNAQKQEAHTMSSTT